MTADAEIQRRIYALMVLMKAADDRLSKGIGTGELQPYGSVRRAKKPGQKAEERGLPCAVRADDPEHFTPAKR